MPAIRHLTLLWKTYTPVEETILLAIAEALPIGSRKLMLSQMRATNKVQRTLDWTEINFYCMRSGKVRWPPEVAFPNSGEFKLATVKYRLASRPFQTTLWAVSGHMFSFVTRPSPKSYCFDRPTEITVILLGDSAAPAGTGPEVMALLPKSFLRFAQNESLPGEIHGWHVPKPSEAHIVHLPEGDFVFLAERDGSEYLLAPTKPGDNRIYHWAESSRLTPVGEDFAQAIGR